MADHIEVLRLHNAWRRDQIDSYPFTAAEIGQAIDAAIAECEDRRRTERNRDMWKGQCDRQAAKLERLHQVVTGEFESKDAFIARVRAVLNGESA